MEGKEHEFCSICKEKTSFLETMNVPQIVDLLKFIIAKMNSKLIQESLTCQTCLCKLREAYKFKISYSEASQKTSLTVNENPDSEECITCEICKTFLSPNDCVPLFDSVTETGLSLIKYFSTELASKAYKNFFTCELCQKSLIKFYDFTNLLSNYGQDPIDQIYKSDNENVKKEPEKMEDEYNSNVDETLTLESKEMSDISEAVKDEIEIEESCLKDEGVEFKIEKEETVEVERFEQQNKQKEKILTILLDPISEVHMLGEDKSYDGLKVLQCHTCEFQTKFKCHLERHMLVHSNYNEVEIFKCTHCQYEAKCKDHLKIHMLKHKNPDGIKMFKCNYCEYETKHKSYLKQHMLNHKNSNEVEMLKCNKCQYETKHKSYLKKHMLTHKNSNEVETFKCNNCKYETKYKHSLKRHMFYHKKPDEVEMFKCNKCQYETKHKSYLKKHMLNHKNPDEGKMFKCNYCEYGTKHKNVLPLHMLIHSDEAEILKCKNCEFKTKHKQSLKNHLLQHKNPDEVEIFKCHNCEYATKWTRDFKSHMLQHKNSDDVEMFTYYNQLRSYRGAPTKK